MNYTIGVYNSFVDFIEKNLNYNFYFRKYDYKINGYRFKTHEEMKETIENKRKKKYRNVIYCRGKNNNYLIEQYQTSFNGEYECESCVAFDISYVYEKHDIDAMKKSDCFFIPEKEDFELFDYVFDNYLVDFLRNKHSIREYKWIKEKILEKSDFKPSSDKKILQYCFIGSSDPYEWESYIGHRVVKKHGHKLLKKYKKTSIYVDRDYVYMK